MLSTAFYFQLVNDNVEGSVISKGGHGG